MGDAEYGKVNPETLEWVLAQADKAAEEGKVVIAAIHHQLLQHYVGQERLMASAATEDGESIARQLADHGVRVVLTGHMHTPNVSRIKGYDTEGVLTEISCPSIVTYPSQYRILTINDDFSTLSVDTRYMRSSYSFSDVQQAARDKVESTLGKIISDLVPRYMSAFNQMLATFASEPAFASYYNLTYQYCDGTYLVQSDGETPFGIFKPLNDTLLSDNLIDRLQCPDVFDKLYRFLQEYNNRMINNELKWTRDFETTGLRVKPSPEDSTSRSPEDRL